MSISRFRSTPRVPARSRYTATSVAILVTAAFSASGFAVDYPAENSRYKAIMEGFVSELDEFSEPLENCLAGMKAAKSNEVDPRIKDCRTLEESEHIDGVADFSARIKVPMPDYANLLNAADDAGRGDDFITSYAAYQYLVTRFRDFLDKFNELKALSEQQVADGGGVSEP